MSGTSADGVDVALCRIRMSRDGMPHIKLIGHKGFAYPRQLRSAVLAAMDAETISTAELSRLHWRLGEVYANAVHDAAAKHRIKLDLVGCHGQTIYHQGTCSRYLGSPVRATLQIGEASVIAERLQATVVSDFRPADLAAGGQGAPLVPILDYVMFRSPKVNRILQNLGGISNLTAIPAGASHNDVMAFDTGPANVVIDGVMAKLFRRAFDRDGSTARKGTALLKVVEALMRDSYFHASPPKSCGREEFAGAYVDKLISLCRRAGAKDTDIVATATLLTAESILSAYRQFVWMHLGQKAPSARSTEYVVAGGGAKNKVLINLLKERLTPLDVKVLSMENFGLPSQAKEAVAFALMAWLTLHQLPGNLPSATGASRAVILGKITHP